MRFRQMKQRENNKVECEEKAGMTKQEPLSMLTTGLLFNYKQSVHCNSNADNIGGESRRQDW